MFKYQKLEGDQCYMIVPPNFKAAMCGVKYAAQNREGKVTLTYTDNSTESAFIPEYDIHTKDIFEVVGDVQHKARKENAPC